METKKDLLGKSYASDDDEGQFKNTLKRLNSSDKKAY
jgi:hypothetical protein